MILRRRTYFRDYVSAEYGYYMINSSGNGYGNNIYKDTQGNYYNPVYRKFGAEEYSGEFPSDKIDKTKGKNYILLKSYTDGRTIVCMNGNKVYLSTNGGASWSNALFTLNYIWGSGSNNIVMNPNIYFDSSYIYILFETSTSSTMTATSLIVLRLASYNRSSGSVSYKTVTSYNNLRRYSGAQMCTSISPNGFVCFAFCRRYAYSDGGFYIDPLYDQGSTSTVKIALFHLPSLRTTNNAYKLFTINLNTPGLTSSYSHATDMCPMDAHWNWDGTMYGCFLCPLRVAYYTLGSYASIEDIIKININLSGTSISNSTATILNHLYFDRGWKTDLVKLAEHSLEIVSNETVYYIGDSVFIMNINDWSVKLELQSLSSMVSAQGLTLEWNHRPHFALTPDGDFYVAFSTAGHTVFINRRTGKFSKSTKFEEYGSLVNTVYATYMMPKIKL